MGGDVVDQRAEVLDVIGTVRVIDAAVVPEFADRPRQSQREPVLVRECSEARHAVETRRVDATAVQFDHERNLSGRKGCREVELVGALMSLVAPRDAGGLSRRCHLARAEPTSHARRLRLPARKADAAPARDLPRRRLVRLGSRSATEQAREVDRPAPARIPWARTGAARQGFHQRSLTRAAVTRRRSYGVPRSLPVLGSLAPVAIATSSRHRSLFQSAARLVSAPGRISRVETTGRVRRSRRGTAAKGGVAATAQPTMPAIPLRGGGREQRAPCSSTSRRSRRVTGSKSSTIRSLRLPARLVRQRPRGTRR